MHEAISQKKVRLLIGKIRERFEAGNFSNAEHDIVKLTQLKTLLGDDKKIAFEILTNLILDNRYNFSKKTRDSLANHFENISQTSSVSFDDKMFYYTINLLLETNISYNDAKAIAEEYFTGTEHHKDQLVIYRAHSLPIEHNFIVGKDINDYIKTRRGLKEKDVNTIIEEMIKSRKNVMELTSGMYIDFAHEQVKNRVDYSDCITRWTRSFKAALKIVKENPQKKYRYILKTTVNTRDPRIVVINYDIVSRFQHFMNGLTGSSIDEEEEVVVFKAISNFDIIQKVQPLDETD